MDQYEFDSGITKLVNSYGEKFYSNERKIIIWNKLSSISGFLWRRMVDELLVNSRQPPLLKEFEIWLDENKSLEKKPDRIGDCRKCNGFGSLLIEKNGYQYGYRCPCPAGGLVSGLPLEVSHGTWMGR